MIFYYSVGLFISLTLYITYLIFCKIQEVGQGYDTS